MGELAVVGGVPAQQRASRRPDPSKALQLALGRPVRRIPIRDRNSIAVSAESR